MAIQTRPADLPVWAESGSVVQPTNPELQVGWPVSAIPPARQRFNWILNYLGKAGRYFLQRGVPEWSATEDYPIGAKTLSPVDGKTYHSKVININKEPSANPTEWERWGFSLTDLAAELSALFYAKLNATQLWTKAQRGAEGSLPTTTGSVALDLALFNNFGGTITGNITLANPTNIVAGQSGVIRIVNDSTPRTIAYGSVWKAASGGLPSLTATSGAVDLLAYYVESASRITVAAIGDTR